MTIFTYQRLLTNAMEVCGISYSQTHAARSLRHLSLKFLDGNTLELHDISKSLDRAKDPSHPENQVMWDVLASDVRFALSRLLDCLAIF